MFYPNACIMQLLKVAWYRVIALLTLFFGLWYKYHDTALPWNRGFTKHAYINYSHRRLFTYSFSIKKSLLKGEKVVMLFGQRNRWRVSSICMIMSSLSGFSILAGKFVKNSVWNMLLDLVCKLTRIMIQKVAWYYKYRDTCFTVKHGLNRPISH
jgi:hypothetical protein